MTIYPNSVVCLFFDIEKLKGLVFQSFHKIYAVSRSLAAARRRHHVEGCAAETAGSRPQGEERGRRHGKVRTFNNCRIHKKKKWGAGKVRTPNVKILRGVALIAYSFGLKREKVSQSRN